MVFKPIFDGEGVKVVALLPLTKYVPPAGVPALKVRGDSLSHIPARGGRLTIGELYMVIDRKAVSSGHASPDPGTIYKYVPEGEDEGSKVEETIELNELYHVPPAVGFPPN